MSVHIHPTAIVSESAKLGENVSIGPYCIVGGQAKLGDGVMLKSHVIIDGVTEIGEACVIHSFAVLGAPPQHLGHRGEATQLMIGARNQIREHATLHCGTVAGGGVTRVGNDCLIMVGALAVMLLSGPDQRSHVMSSPMAWFGVIMLIWKA